MIGIEQSRQMTRLALPASQNRIQRGPVSENAGFTGLGLGAMFSQSEVVGVMASKESSPTEKETVLQYVKAIVDGSEMLDWEFHTRWLLPRLLCDELFLYSQKLTMAQTARTSSLR